MKIVHEKPPNYNLIKDYFPLKEGTIYTYGDTIYNPSSKEIPDDIIFHEEIHRQQQGKHPDAWWTRYIIDKDFRLEQELQAYSAQYELIKKIYPNNLVKQALEELANNLSSLYNTGIDKHKAGTLIRKYKKD